MGLNMAVGDDLFNRSIYIEDNLSASQNLQRFDKQQEDIWRKCKEREEKRLAEQRRKEEDELRRKQKQEQILAERRAKQEAAKREEEARLKEEELKKQEREAEVLKQERIKLEIQAEKDALAAQKAELEARAKTEADELAKIASEKAALEEELRKMREEKLAQQSPPKISIYTRKQQSEKDHNQDEITEEIKEKFILNGFSDNEIKVIDVSCDMELASFLKNICGDLENLKFPIVCTGNMPIGTIEQVNTLIESESQLQQLKDGTGVFVGQGVLDHCLDAAEYVVSGVSTLLWLPVSIVTYPFRSEKPGLEKGADDVDFDIVHTNW